MRFKQAPRLGPRAALFGAMCVLLLSSVAGELSAGAASHERSLGDKVTSRVKFGMEVCRTAVN